MHLKCETITFEFHNLDEVALAAGRVQMKLFNISEDITVSEAHVNLRKKAEKAEIIFKQDFFDGRFREQQDLECISIKTNSKCYRIYFNNSFSDNVNLNEHVWINDFENVCIAVGDYSESELIQVHERLNYEFE